MFYEEKEIEGILYCRSSPDSNFQACTKFQLTSRIMRHKQDMLNMVEALQKDKVHFSFYQWEKLQQSIPGLV